MLTFFFNKLEAIFIQENAFNISQDWQIFCSSSSGGIEKNLLKFSLEKINAVGCLPVPHCQM